MNTTQHVLRTGSTTVYVNVQDKPYVRGGTTYTRSADEGHNVAVTPGVSVRLFGTDKNRYGGPVKYDLTFNMGDTCERDAYNLVYTGTIVAIGAKTITVKDDCLNKTTRMSIAQFSRRNRDFDLARISKRNSEWMD